MSGQSNKSQELGWRGIPSEVLPYIILMFAGSILPGLALTTLAWISLVGVGHDDTYAKRLLKFELILGSHVSILAIGFYFNLMLALCIAIGVQILTVFLLSYLWWRARKPTKSTPLSYQEQAERNIKAAGRIAWYRPRNLTQFEYNFELLWARTRYGRHPIFTLVTLGFFSPAFVIVSLAWIFIFGFNSSESRIRRWLKAYVFAAVATVPMVWQFSVIASEVDANNYHSAFSLYHAWVICFSILWLLGYIHRVNRIVTLPRECW